jgi:hypothetical protein
MMLWRVPAGTKIANREYGTFPALMLVQIEPAPVLGGRNVCFGSVTDATEPH